jgi:putative transposase
VVRRTDGVRRKFSADQIAAKLRQVDRLVAQGRTVYEAVRTTGVTDVTYYKWRSEYGGRKGVRLERLQELEAENARLRRLLSEMSSSPAIATAPAPEAG